eukprot:976505-Alexandrium_andersonii.AAC.1
MNCACRAMNAARDRARGAGAAVACGGPGKAAGATPPGPPRSGLAALLRACCDVPPWAVELTFGGR